MYSTDKPTFNVNEPFLGVTIVQLNRPMVDLLIHILSDQEGKLLPKEVWAFVRALNDPDGCREMRAQRKRLMRPIRPTYKDYNDYTEEYDDTIDDQPQ